MNSNQFKTAFILAAAVSATFAQAETSKNTAGPVRNGQNNGTNNPAVTISFSGQTALRDFSKGVAISELTAGTSITLHNGTNGAPITYYAPDTGGTLVQLASRNFGNPDSGIVYTGLGDAPTSQTHSALRLEWHEQGSVEGQVDLINDQVGYYPSNPSATSPDDAGPVSNLNVRGPSVANPTWVNGGSFTAGGSQAGFSLSGATGLAAYNTYDPNVYDFATGTNKQGGQNRIQFSVGEYKTEGLAKDGTPSLTAAPGSAGYGQGNPALAKAALLSGTGTVNARQQFHNEKIVNQATDKVDPQTGVNYSAGPWNSAGEDNIDSRQIAVTAVPFVANPGTGLTHIDKGDAQWLQTTGRLQNGADFNSVSREVNTGQRIVPAVNTGIDPSWAVGENDGGDTGTSAQATAQSAIGPNLRFSGKTSGTFARNAIAQNRMAFGPLSLSETRGAGNTAPVRTLDVDFSDAVNGVYQDQNFVHLNFDSFVSFQYKNILISHYNTVKAPNAAYANATTEQWKALSSAQTGIKGDPYGDVQAFINNISNAIVTTSNGQLATSAANPADGLLAAGYFLPGLMDYTRVVDGGALDPNPLSSDQITLRNLIKNTYTTIFTTDGSPGSSTQTIGTGATYGALGTASATVGSVPITAKNYLFGNFNQDGRRDYASVKEAVNAALSLRHADSAGSNNIFTGVNNSTVVASQSGTPGWSSNGANTKGDLIVLGDYNGDGAFDGGDLNSLARGASLVDKPTGNSPIGEHLNGTFADRVRDPNAVLRKNDALTFVKNVTSDINDPAQTFLRKSAESAAAQANDAANNYLNAFNKFDVNRDGLVNRVDAQIVDHFEGQNYHNLDQQLAAVIATNGTIVDGKTITGAATTETARQFSLVDAELNDDAAIDNTDFALLRTDLGSKLLDGDADFNGAVDVADFTAFFAHFGQNSNVSWSDGDFDSNGSVDVADFTSFFANFGASNPNLAPGLLAFADAHGVPEPSSIAGLLGGALLARRRRRK